MTLLNTAPTASISGPTDGVPGQPRTFTFGAGDPSSIDQAAGFAYVIDWGDGTPVQTVARSPGNGAGVALDHVYTVSGSFAVQVTATDKDGGASAIVTRVQTIQTVQLQEDSLAVGGTLSGDTITITPADTLGNLSVTINTGNTTVALGNFHPTGHILVYGQAGDDVIQLLSKRSRERRTT